MPYIATFTDWIIFLCDEQKLWDELYNWGVTPANLSDFYPRSRWVRFVERGCK